MDIVCAGAALGTRGRDRRACMTSGESDAELREKDRKRREVDALITELYGPEDDALRATVAAAAAAPLPPIQISPLQGQLLRVLAAACGARRILEIGALAGYSGIWLARALPPGGRLISLELEP